jgi:hypothetical protein
MRLVVLCVYSFICARDVEILPRDRVYNLSLRLTRICGLQRGRLKPAASHRSEMRCRRKRRSGARFRAAVFKRDHPDGYHALHGSLGSLKPLDCRLW